MHRILCFSPEFFLSKLVCSNDAPWSKTEKLSALKTSCNSMFKHLSVHYLTDMNEYAV